MRGAGNAQHDLLGDDLARAREIHLALGQQCLGLARRPVEELIHRRAGHRQAGDVVEITGVEFEGAVVLEVEEIVEDTVDVFALAIGGQSHQLVFAGVDLEAREIRESRVEQAQRVRELDISEGVNFGPAAIAIAGGGPLADPVEGHDRRFLVGRGIKGRRRVRLVVVAEEHGHLAVELALDQLRDPQLLLEPDHHALPVEANAQRGRAQMGFEQAFESQQWLVVKADTVEVFDPDARLLQAVAYGVGGKIWVVLHARKALFLRGGDNFSIADQASGAIVVKRGKAEYISTHGNLDMAGRASDNLRSQ